MIGRGVRERAVSIDRPYRSAGGSARTMTRALVLVLLASLASAGCAWISRATEPATQAAGELLLSPEQERQLGDQLAAQVKSEEPVLQDPQVQDYVRRVGQQVVQAVPEDQRKGFVYSFTVLDTPETVNAFALPGGHVFVNSGLVRAADSEAELASVLAHEVAHVTEGHVADQLAAQVGAQSLAQLALGQSPDQLARLGAAVATRGYLAAYSRDAEAEADATGLQFLAAANYDLQAMPRFFQKLAAMFGGAGSNFVARFFASHPPPANRAQRLQRLIEGRDFGPGRQAIVGRLEAIQARVN